MCKACGCRTDGDDDSSSTRVLQVELDLLAKNRALAERNRGQLLAHDTLTLNLMSSPGAGKTTLLVATIEAAGGRWPVAVIEGDQATDRDAARVRATGVPAVQLNTARSCHLDAARLADALAGGIAPRGGVLFIENVGNLICPAGFDLGERRKVVLASVAEGDDKPLKYPSMFAVADLVLVTKGDLLPHVDFDLGAFERDLRRVNRAADLLVVSARTGAGLDDWVAWIAHARDQLRTAA